MEEGVTNQEAAVPEEKAQVEQRVSDKEHNFRRLEAAREAEREARIRAEMELQMLRGEMQEIKSMLRPREKDPLDDVEDYVDPARLKAKLELERAAFERKAKDIAKSTYDELKREDQEKEKKDFMTRLKREYPDYDAIMNENTLASLEKIDPLFVDTVLAIPDDYERRKKTYAKIKSLPKQEPKASIKERVEENQKNPYYIPAGSGASGGLPSIEFDVSSKTARESAYAKLKAAQRRPITGGHAQPNQ